jgi:hypothetical protein
MNCIVNTSSSCFPEISQIGEICHCFRPWRDIHIDISYRPEHPMPDLVPESYQIEVDAGFLEGYKCVLDVRSERRGKWSDIGRPRSRQRLMLRVCPPITRSISAIRCFLRPSILTHEKWKSKYILYPSFWNLFARSRVYCRPLVPPTGFTHILSRTVFIPPSPSIASAGLV